jgi:hypothetical protein
MSDTITARLSPVSPVVGVLVCECCGQVRNLSAAEVVRYVETRWPDCCGRVMRLPSDRTDRRGD